MKTVQWLSSIATHADVWRVLDLSGMTKSVRESRNFLRAGFVFLNGNPVRSKASFVKVGTTFTLELRFPNNKIVQEQIHLVSRPVVRKPRSNMPTTLYRKG